MHIHNKLLCLFIWCWCAFVIAKNKPSAEQFQEPNNTLFRNLPDVAARINKAGGANAPRPILWAIEKLYTTHFTLPLFQLRRALFISFNHLMLAWSVKLHRGF
jgi:hypothetical protein